MKKLSFFLLFVLVLSLVPVLAQQNNNPGNNNNEIISGGIAGNGNNGYPSDSIFVINSFDYKLKGRTRVYALEKKIDLVTGEEITGYSNFERYIQNKKQLLINERVLKDNIIIEYTIEEAREDGKYPVNLTIIAEDTWNIMALPYPKYDTNSGFELTVKIRDYNFLGTMTPLRLDVGYIYDEEKRHIFKSLIDADIPFKLFGLYWTVDFDNYFNYQPNKDFHYYYANHTGLFVDIPIGRTTLNIGFSEYIVFNEENSNNDKDLTSKNFQEGLYMSSRPEISWKIPTGFKLGEYRELTYTPKISAAFNHEILPWTLLETKKGPFLTFSHLLMIERIDWIGNFKKGYTASINNSFNFNFFYMSTDRQPFASQEYFTSYLDVNAAAYFIFTDFLGFYTRFKYRHWFNSYGDSAGDVLRGFRDSYIKSDYMISLNIDIPIRVLKVRLSEWFKTNFKAFDCDIQISPTIDAAVYQEHTGDALGPGYFILAAGAEMIVYPLATRSMFMRISFAYGLLSPEKLKGYELFIGMELHY